MPGAPATTSSQPPTLAELATSVKAKAQALTALVVQLRAELEQARAAGADLEAKATALEKSNEALRLDNEWMKTAAAVAPSRESRAHARAVIADMLKEVDRCLAALGDAPAPL